MFMFIYQLFWEAATLWYQDMKYIQVMDIFRRIYSRSEQQREDGNTHDSKNSK